MEALADCEIDPRIISVTYCYELPKSLRSRYTGKSQMGRIYVLDLGGRIVHLWSEAGLYEEAAWHGSRLLDPIRDAQVIDCVS